MAQLDVDFIDTLRTLSLPEFAHVLKVIAHPNFFNLLAKLPKTTTYEQLNAWLEKMPEDLPEETQEALKEFQDYHTNSETIAARNKQAFAALHQEHTLTVDDLKAELGSLKPKPFVQVPVKNAVRSSEVLAEDTSPAQIEESQGFDYSILVRVLILAALIAVCVLYFSIPTVVVCSIVCVLITCSLFESQVSALYGAGANPKTEASEEGSMESDAVKENQSEIVQEPSPKEVGAPAPYSEPNSGLGFFDGKAAPAVTVSKADDTKFQI
jgi:hypothetical protein